MKKRAWLHSTYIALLVAVLAGILWSIPQFRLVEEPLYNLNPGTIKLPGGSRDSVIILLKDEDVPSGGTLSGGLFRKLVARLNHEMRPGTKENPRLLLFDYFYFFGAPGWTGRDSFEKEIKKFNGKVVFSGMALSESGPTLTPDADDFTMPSIFFSDGSPVAMANVPLAPDGSVHFVHWDYHDRLSRVLSRGGSSPPISGGIPALVDQENGFWIAHWAELGVAAYMLENGLYGKADPDQVVPQNEDEFGKGTHRITLRFPRSSGKGFLGGFFATYTVSEILNNKLDADDMGVKPPPDQALKNARLIFVGDDRAVRQELHGTPAGVVPSIFIPAVVAWDLFNHKFVYPLPDWVQYLTILLFSLLPVFFLNRTLKRARLAPSAILFRLMGVKGSRPIVGFVIILYSLLSLDFFLVRGVWSYNLALVFPAGASILSFAAISFYLTLTAEAEVSKTVGLLSRYLSPELAQAYRENPEDLDLEGRLDTVTILFCDVRGFTTASEKMPPAMVVESLKAYYDAAGSIIIGKGGFLAKFIGDAIMGVFSEPYPRPDDSVRAVEAGLEILEAIERLNGKWKKRGREPWSIGIGINTGKAVWGAMGFKDKEELTIIGDAVNVASRLEGLTKEYRVPIILSESTYQSLDKQKNGHTFTHLGETTVRGRSEPLSIWTIERGEKHG